MYSQQEINFARIEKAIEFLTNKTQAKTNMDHKTFILIQGSWYNDLSAFQGKMEVSI